MKIEIYSDFACPYCYIGEKKLDLALKDFEGRETVEVTFKSFQLNPEAKKVIDGNMIEHLAKKYQMSYEQAQAQVEGMVNSAANVGLDYRFDVIQPNNTALAHQVAKFARDEQCEKPMVDRLFKAYFEQGIDIGDKETLLSLAEEVGMDGEKLKKAIEDEGYLTEVLNDQKNASNLGIQGVPYFIIDEKVAVYGAQSVEHFKAALDKASV